jgi:hypothetical protein
MLLVNKVRIKMMVGEGQDEFFPSPHQTTKIQTSSLSTAPSSRPSFSYSRLIVLAIQDDIQGIGIIKYTKNIRDRYQITGMHILYHS